MPVNAMPPAGMPPGGAAEPFLSDAAAGRNRNLVRRQAGGSEPRTWTHEAQLASVEWVQVDEGEVARGELVAACRDPTTLFDPIEEPLDPVAGRAEKRLEQIGLIQSASVPRSAITPKSAFWCIPEPRSQEFYEQLEAFDPFVLLGIVDVKWR